MRGIVILIGGIAHTIPEWAEISGVGPKTISRRIDRGFNGAEIIAPTEHLLRKRAMIHEVWKGGNFIWIKE